MIYNIFTECRDKYLKNKVYKILKNKRSSQSPTIIQYPKYKQIWLFFFSNDELKSTWIYDEIKSVWNEIYLNVDIKAVCTFDDEIYALTKKNKILIKKTGSRFPSC